MILLNDQTIEIFRLARKLYFDLFVEVAESLDQTALQIEPVLVDGEGEPIREGHLNTPIRADLIDLGEEPKQYMVDSSKTLHFETFSVTTGRVNITISPFNWDALIVTYDHSGSSADKGLMEWFETHFKEHPNGENLTCRCIHFLSDPEFVDGQSLVQVDLGTAPVQALLDLLSALEASGATQISLASAFE